MGKEVLDDVFPMLQASQDLNLAKAVLRDAFVSANLFELLDGHDGASLGVFGLVDDTASTLSDLLDFDVFLGHEGGKTGNNNRK